MDLKCGKWMGRGKVGVTRRMIVRELWRQYNCNAACMQMQMNLQAGKQDNTLKNGAKRTEWKTNEKRLIILEWGKSKYSFVGETWRWWRFEPEAWSARLEAFGSWIMKVRWGIRVDLMYLSWDIWDGRDKRARQTLLYFANTEITDSGRKTWSSLANPRLTEAVNYLIYLTIPGIVQK